MDMDAFYSSAAWRDIAARRLAADGNRCTVARLLGDDCDGCLHVHHIRPARTHPELALDFENTATTCARHHPILEGLRRRLVTRGVPSCRELGHRHPYRVSREACERRRLARAIANADPPKQLTLA